MYPSPPGSRGSAQGFLDVSRPGTEERMKKMCCVFRAWRETVRKRDDMKRQIWAHNQVDLEPPSSGPCFVCIEVWLCDRSADANWTSRGYNARSKFLMQFLLTAYVCAAVKQAPACGFFAKKVCLSHQVVLPRLCPCVSPHSFSNTPTRCVLHACGNVAHEVPHA